MKKLLLGAVGLIAMATSASAADLAARPYTKAPVALPVIYDWTGFYIGANGGWGQSRDCWGLVTVAGPAVINEGCASRSGGSPRRPDRLPLASFAVRLRRGSTG